MLNTSLLHAVLREVKKQNDLEDQIAHQLYGCSYNELDYDQQEEVTNEVQDRIDRLRKSSW